MSNDQAKGYYLVVYVKYIPYKTTKNNRLHIIKYVDKNMQ
jgi:hypothetical protein